jgi:hypothetical protein
MGLRSGQTSLNILRVGRSEIPRPEEQKLSEGLQAERQFAALEMELCDER